MNTALRLVAFLAGLLAACSSAFAQSEDDAIILVAHPAFRDLEYRQTVLIAAPAPNGGHVGVILNRPTRRSLGSLFPEHEPSKRVADPVYYGGPFSRGALVALVKADSAPGAGSVLLMKNLYLAFRANTIDHFAMTKRPILDNGYFETFNRDNVTLVDLREDPIERFTPESVVTRTGEHPSSVME